MRKPTMWILTRSDTNQAGQPLKVARGLKFCIKEVEVLYYPSSENKEADQLRGYREADLRPYFRICKSLVFSRGGSIMVTNLLIAQPYTQEKITRVRVPMVTNLLKAHPTQKKKSLGQGSRRHCGDNQNVIALHLGSAIPSGLLPAHLRGWGIGYGAWILMA